MKLSYYYMDELIEFDLERRKRKSISIIIHPKKNIRVLAPRSLAKEDILKFVKSKSNWIKDKLDKIKEIRHYIKEKEFKDGEKFFYLGKRYTLKIIKDKNYIEPKVTLYRGHINIYTKSVAKSNIKKALIDWYKIKAEEKIINSIEKYQKYIDIKPRHIKIKEQKRRWGSCSSNKDLFFNWKIIMAPSKIIDYLVVHEMSHLIHMNHSKSFWNLVAKIIPDYKSKREYLKKEGFKYDI